MKEYTIQKDEHDFRPKDGFGFLPWFWLKNRALMVSVEFDKNCLYDFGGDEDAQDWAIKLPSISLNPIWKPKNHKAAIVAARSNPETREIEVSAYFNFAKGKHYAKWDHDVKAQDAVFLPGEKLVYIIWAETRSQFGVRLFRKSHTGQLTRRDAVTDNIYFDWDSDAAWMCAPVGMWFEAKDNKGNGVGGAAPQEMSVKINKAWEKQSELRKRHLI